MKPDRVGIPSSALGRLAVLTLFALALTGTSALAESCLDQVHSLADDHKMTIDPPNVANNGGESNPIGSEDLAQSGGVIEPPSTSGRSIIDPPEDLQYGMETVPTPDSGRLATTDADSLRASDRMIAESVLMSARVDAERGDELDCFDKLRKAKEIMQR